MAQKKLTFEEKVALAIAKDEARKQADVDSSAPTPNKNLSFEDKIKLAEERMNAGLIERATENVRIRDYEQYEDENYNALQRNITRPLGYGLNRLGEGLATTAEVYGGGIGDETIRSLTPDGPQDYIPASELFANKNGDGFGWSNLPAAIMEAGPGMAGTAAAAAAGGLVAGPVGAMAAGTGFNTAVGAGDTARSRAIADGRSVMDITNADRLAGLGTAAAVGAVETLPFARGAGGLVRRAVTEGGTEAIQSGVQQAGTTLGTEQGLTIDPKQAAAEAMIGAGAGAGIRPAIDATGRGVAATGAAVGDVRQAGADALGKLAAKTDVETQTVDQYDVKLAEMYKANGAKDTFNDPYTDRPNESARGTLDTVEKRLKARITTKSSELQKLVKKDSDVLEELKAVTSLGGTRTGRIDDATFEKLDPILGAEPAYSQFKEAIILNQRNTMLRDNNKLTGGVGGFVDNALSTLPIIGNKFTPIRNAGDDSAKSLATDTAVATGIGLATGGVGLAGLATVPAAKIAISKLDKFTNRQSKPKRWLDTVDEAQKQSRVIPKEIVKADLLALATNAKAEREALLVQKTGKPNANIELTRANNRAMFETGKIPETEYYAPYKIWSEVIGKNPKEIITGIQLLEQEGVLEQGTTERFEVNIRSFSTKGNETYDIQEAVRQRINPEYSPLKAKAERAKNDPRNTLKILEASKTGVSTNRSQHKAKEGSRRAQNVIAEIENSREILLPNQYLALHKLKEAIDRPDVTALERERMIKDVLPTVFDSPIELMRWSKVMIPLATIGNDKPIYRKDEESAPMVDPNQLTLPL